MERRSKFLTFILAMIPGVGQMYLGLLRKGIQLLLMFILIEPVFDIIGLGYIGGMLKLCVWAYAFWDTFDIGRRMDKGEAIRDTDFVINKYMNKSEDGEFNFTKKVQSYNKSFWIFCGWGLILVGILAILNLRFGTNDLYGQIKSVISTYFVPALLVLAGIYMLLRNKKE